MFKICKGLVGSWRHSGKLAHHQSCRYFLMTGKQFEPPAFDILIQDLDQKDLHSQISSILKKQYLFPLQKDENEHQNIRTGVMYGAGRRGLISLPTRTDKSEPIWVHYLIDTGSPYTFLTKSVLEALKCDHNQNLFSVLINRHRHSVMMSKNNFCQVNILGMDYLDNRLEMGYDFIGKRIKIVETDIE